MTKHAGPAYLSRIRDAIASENPGLLRGVTLALLLGAAAVFIGQLFVILNFAVDVPFSDEWEFFQPGSLRDGLSLKWLFAAHNEHRIVPTKLLTLLLFGLTGLDFTVSAAVTYLLYGATAAGLLLVVWRAAPKESRVYALWFAPFLFSPINYDNLYWGFQSQFHFYALFFFAAVAFLFSGRQLAGAALAVVAVFSFTSGVTSALVLLAGAGAFAWFTKERSRLLVAAAIIAVAVVAWLATFHRVEGHGAMTPPTTRAFWAHYLNVLALGLGVMQKSKALGAVMLVLAVVPCAFVLARHRRDAGAWQLAIISAALLAADATISLGRAGLGVDQAKESRYAEYGLLLLPVAAAALAWSLEGKRFRFVALAALWLVCFGSFWKEWSASDYRRLRDDRLTGQACVRAADVAASSVMCPSVYPGDLAELLRGARQMNASFLRPE